MEAKVLDVLPNARAFDGMDGYLCPWCDAWTKRINDQHRIMKCDACGEQFYLSGLLHVAPCMNSEVQ